jgi:hypothetical protein
MPRYRIDFDGVDLVKRKYGRSGARKLRKRVGLAIEEGVRGMAENSYQRSPKDTTALANSILASVQKEAPLTWYYGSTMPYAQRQEYEHKTKRGYFRFAIWEEAPIIKGRIEWIIGDTFK